MFCEKCGSKLQEGDVFCENCGERVPEMAVAASKQASETFSGIGNGNSFSNPQQQNNAF